MASLMSIAGLFGWAFDQNDKPTPGPRAAAGTILRRTSLQKQQREIAINQRRQKETPKRLLENPRLWPHEPEKWIGLKILGQGSFGTASLWEFVGDGSPEDDANPLLGEKVVLKTGINHPSTMALYEEGRIMKWLMKRNDSHIVKLIYNLSEEAFDKLYMEFCKFGDLAAQIRERCRLRQPWSEKELWKMFFCLAKACQTMARADANGNSLLHMDMKPHNILLQEKGRPDHDCPGGFVQYKIADFGLAYEEKFPVFYSRYWRPKGMGRGTPSYKAPEQWFRGLQFGEKMNIWGVGTIMFQAILLDHKPPPGPRPIVKAVRQTVSYDKFKPSIGVNLIPALKKGHAYGSDLERRPEIDNYSDALVATIFHCLMHEPKYRSSADELVSRIGKHIREKYGDEDDEYEAELAQKEESKQEMLRAEERKTAEKWAEAERIASIIKLQPKPHMRLGEETLREKLENRARDDALAKKLKEEADCEREQELKDNPPPLWILKHLTDDYDTAYWINTKTGFCTWDDPWEDPPNSRMNLNGVIRPFLEQSPIEQLWVATPEEYQGGWRVKYQRSDTHEKTYIEPEIFTEWKLWWRAHWVKTYSNPRLVLPPKPERMVPDSQEFKWFHNWWEVI